MKSSVSGLFSTTHWNSLSDPARRENKEWLIQSLYPGRHCNEWFCVGADQRDDLRRRLIEKVSSLLCLYLELQYRRTEGEGSHPVRRIAAPTARVFRACNLPLFGTRQTFPKSLLCPFVLPEHPGPGSPRLSQASLLIPSEAAEDEADLS